MSHHTLQALSPPISDKYPHPQQSPTCELNQLNNENVTTSKFSFSLTSESISIHFYSFPISESKDNNHKFQHRGLSHIHPTIFTNLIPHRPLDVKFTTI
jgi:hypothetical protein